MQFDALTMRFRTQQSRRVTYEAIFARGQAAVREPGRRRLLPLPRQNATGQGQGGRRRLGENDEKPEIFVSFLDGE